MKVAETIYRAITHDWPSLLMWFKIKAIFWPSSLLSDFRPRDYAMKAAQKYPIEVEIKLFCKKMMFHSFRPLKVFHRPPGIASVVLYGVPPSGYILSIHSGQNRTGSRSNLLKATVSVRQN